MKVSSLFEKTTAPITPEMEQNFKRVYTHIKGAIEHGTGVQVSPRWLAGFLNQYLNYKNLNQIYDNQVKSGQGNSKDTKARIIARDALAGYKLVNPANGYLPLNKPLISTMRQYYSDSARMETGANDMAKHTREANAQEYDEWFNSLSNLDKNYVKNLQELEPDELASFKGILHAKENKQEFATRLLHWSQTDDVAHHILQSMGMVTADNKLHLNNIEKLRTFLASVTDARLKDIMSKSTVYSGKSIVHAAKRSSNKILKDLEHEPNGKQGLILKLYHYISKKVKDKTDKERSFRRMLEKIPLAHTSEGKPSEIGKGAYALFKQFGGKTLDPEQAITTLNQRYHEPADLPHRAEKASGRGESIRKVADI